MSALHFLLNDREIRTDVHPATLVLDFLRDLEGLKGTKEGCREGDCGACVVLVGRLTSDGIEYRPVTSCLVPIGSVHGRHVVTIEGLNVEDLSPVQEAIVYEGGSQCGFCTPGIVVSLTGAILESHGPLNREDVKEALGGHLCRCTGYRSLKVGYKRFNEQLPDTFDRKDLVESGAIPLYFNNIEDRLKAIGSIPSWNGEEAVHHRIAGGTDLYVQRGDDLPRTTVDVLDHNGDLDGIEDRGDWIDVGAGTSFEDFGRSEIIQEIVPEIRSYMHLIASVQIRNRATLGGNVINASPIGDMTILLLALESELVLSGLLGERRVPLSSFYKGYKLMDIRPDEVLTRILIPRPSPSTRISWEKVSKRKTLDIATVNFAAAISVSAGIIDGASLAMGGVAPVPLYLRDTSRSLLGQPLSQELVAAASEVLQREMAPISDIRGSAAYKRLLGRQLMFASFSTLFPDLVPLEDLV